MSGSDCGRTRLFLNSGWNFRVSIVSESDFYPVDAPKHSEWRHPTEWETAAVPELCLQANGLWHDAPPQSAAALTVAAGGWKWGQHLIRAKEGFVQAAGCLPLPQVTVHTDAFIHWQCITSTKEVMFSLALACLFVGKQDCSKIYEWISKKFSAGGACVIRKGTLELDGDSHHDLEENLHNRNIVFLY